VLQERIRSLEALVKQQMHERQSVDEAQPEALDITDPASDRVGLSTDAAVYQQVLPEESRHSPFRWQSIEQESTVQSVLSCM